MTPFLIITLFATLEIKHYLLDFRFQPPWMFLNKGTLWHWGGIVHSGGHALATVFILLFLIGWPALLLGLLEFLIHYATDFWKVNYNKKMGWACNTHAEFWYLTGLDQLVHHLTYCLLLGLCLLVV